MELFRRVKQAAREVAGSEAKLASRLDIPQTTFSGYLKPSRQHKLWPLLPNILEALPQVSREWLYFDEGEMFRTESAEATDKRVGAAGPTVQELTAKVRELEVENSRLKDKLIAALEENSLLRDIIQPKPQRVGSESSDM